MKSFFKKLAFVMALAMVVSLAAPAAAKTAYAASNITISYQNEKSTITELNIAKVGQSEDLKFVGAPSNWKSLNPTWKSSDESVATVDQNGVVTAVAAGTAVVTFTCGDQSASVKVNCVNTATYTATIGVASDKNMSAKTIEVGGEFDFAFYGIKDYSADRYFCTWASDDQTVLEKVNEAGLFKAVKPGTAKVTLIVFNKVTGQVHNVAPVLVTVESEEPIATPTPAMSISAKQTTQDEMVVSFTGVDVSALGKFNIEVYEQYENDYEYIWQIFSIDPDKDTNTVKVTGYDEFIHNTDYVVRLVKEENGEVLTDGDGNPLEYKFTASVGPVSKVEASFASYLNNQGVWFFQNKAYTNGNDGEEIQTKLSYKLYDAAGIDVTKHYSTVGYSNVRFEIIDDDLAPYVTFVDDDRLVFSEILNQPLKIVVTYEDYDERVTGGINIQTCPLILRVEKAPTYKVNAIDKWVIDNANTSKKETNQDIALFDDYDYVASVPLSNHELVIWFTDNYGNKFVTKAAYQDNEYKPTAGSDKFTNEGYEIRYESRNPQVLVVGDEEDATVSNVINTKKVGTASVNVTLHNVLRDYEDKTLVSYMDVIRIPVKAERKLTTVSATSVNVTSDSRYTMPENGSFTHDPRFTTAKVNVTAYDQYGVEWGTVNSTAAAATYIDSEVVKTTLNNNSAVTLLLASHDAVTDLGDNDGIVYSWTFDGFDLFAQAGDPTKSTSTVQYNVTVTDEMKDIVKTARFTVTMKQPTEDADGNIVASKVLKLNASDVNFTNLKTKIEVIEQSSNKLDVNYKDDITPIYDVATFNKIFSKSVANANRIPAAKGDLFLAVYDSKNQIVGASSGCGTIGIEEVESGLYNFYIAALNGGSENTRFATAGTYTVKLLQVTNTNNSGNTGIVTGFSTVYTKTFKVVDDRIKITMNNQKSIYLPADTTALDGTPANSIKDIAEVAFAYSVNLSKTDENDKSRVSNENIVGVRFRVSEKQNYTVIQDVFMKVLLDTDFDGEIDSADDGSFYYVEVPVDRTVRLEDVTMANGTTVPFGKDPQGDKMR